MSGGVGTKRKMRFLDPPFDETIEDQEDHLIIVSNFGDTRPEESEPDTVTAFFLGQGVSVTNYLVVPGIGAQPKFLANYRDVYDENADGTPHAKKGQLRNRYVKKMVPSTRDLTNIACHVMVLFCHGAGLPTHPHYMCFHERDSVSVRGYRAGPSPEATTVWSCSSCTRADAEGKMVTYEKPDGGVTLSQVVERSKLVLLLSCCGENIMREYESEAGDTKPDFVVFWLPRILHDISHNIFIALLINAIENCSDYRHTWDEIVRRCVCRVLWWIKVYGKEPDRFWLSLQRDEVISEGQNPTRSIQEQFRIKGCITTFNAGIDATTKIDDKDLFLRELQAATLMIWNDGRDGKPRGYTKIDQQKTAGELDDLVHGVALCREPQKCSQLVSKAAAAQPFCGQQAQLDVLLAQLKGLMLGI